MSRRVFLAILSVVLVVVAAAPWTTSSSRIRASVARQVKALSGLDLAVGGRTTIAFLPLPRIKLGDITLSTPDGTRLVEGGQLRGEVRLLPLLAARFEIAELSLAGSRITVARDAEGRSPWDPTIAQLRDLVRQGGASPEAAVHRVVLSETALDIRDAGRLGNLTLADLALSASWPASTGVLEASASFRFKDEAVSLTLSDLMPAALLAGQPSRVSLLAKGASGAVSITGEARTQPDLQWRGQSTITTGSLRAFTRWAGLPVPLADRIGSFALAGDFVASDRDVSWPDARLTVGKDRLDGSLSILREAGRPLVRATLAGNQVDLSGFVAPFTSLRSERGAWINAPFTPGMASEGNLDLRLSAASAQIGPLKLDDVAAALLLTENRMEMSLARAGIEGGSLKGRMALGIGSGFYDLKAQGTFDKIDVAALLADFGQKPWLSGRAQGQFTVDSFGESPADLMRQVGGKGSVTVRQGELAGVAFDDLLRRSERRPYGHLEWRGGRTAFDTMQVGLQAANGTAEITEGILSASGFKTSLQGRIALPDQTLALRAQTDTSAVPPGAPSLVLDVTGPWFALTILPSLEAAIHRSEGAPTLAR